MGYIENFGNYNSSKKNWCEYECFSILIFEIFTLSTKACSTTVEYEVNDSPLKCYSFNGYIDKSESSQFGWTMECPASIGYSCSVS